MATGASDAATQYIQRGGVLQTKSRAVRINHLNVADTIGSFRISMFYHKRQDQRSCDWRDTMPNPLRQFLW